MEQANTPSTLVFKYIERKILEGEWKSGDKISTEVQLAKELHVSRMSVREAVEKLVALNILTKKRGSGTFVNEVSPDTYLKNLIPFLTIGEKNFANILEIRMALDVLSVRKFIENWDVDLISKLEEVCEKMEENSDSREAQSELDKEFHKIIALGTKNDLLISLTETLFQTLNVFTKSNFIRREPKKRLEEHVNILNAIKSRDKKLAKLFMKRHLKETMTVIRNENETETESSE